MGKVKREILKRQNMTRHAFLLTFFDKPDKYEEKQVNGFMLIRQFNAGNGNWEVAIYSMDAYLNKQKYRDQHSRGN